MLKHKLTLLIFFILIIPELLKSQAPSWQWAAGGSGSSSENVNSITSDATGNVYATGFFYSTTIVFGTYTLTNSGNYDFFIVKYNSAGNVVWAKSGGGIYDDAGSSIALDGAGNVYVTGYFYSPMISIGTLSLTNVGVGDAFVLKFDASGNEIWMTGIGDVNDENGNGISADNAGNIYVTGFFQSPSLSVGSTTLSNAGNTDIFLIRLDNNGNPVWAKSAQGSAADAGKSVTVDATGNIYVCGYYSANAAFDSYSLTSTGSTDAFVAKYDGSGNAIWVRSCGGSLNDASYAVAIDGTGNVYTTGTFLSGTLTVGSNTISNAGNNDLFIVKYNSSGILSWAKSAGGIQDDTGYGITADNIGNVYITGHFHSPSISFGSYTLTNNGIGDSYVAQYDGSGNVLWAEGIGGTADDGGSCITANSSNVFCGGFFFSPVLMVGPYTLTNGGSDDIYILKLGNLLTGIESKDWSGQAVVYPNPSSGIFNLLIEENADIEIYSMEGIKMYYTENREFKHRSICLNGAATGVYLLKIYTASSNYCQKILVH